MMMAWCADVVLLPLARMYAGPQPCVVTSLNSYKQPRQTTLSAGDPCQRSRDVQVGIPMCVPYSDVKVQVQTRAGT